MDKGPLTLDDVPDELLAECGLRRGGATTAAYLYTDASAELVPIAKLTAPARKLNRERLASILRGFRDGNRIKPVPAYHDTTADVVNVLDGLHRWRCSRAYGFTHIPCLLVSLTEAVEAGYKPR